MARQGWRATAAAVALVLTGCSLGDEEPQLEAEPIPAPERTPAQPVGLARYLDQEIAWEPCRSEAECATLEVPLDYAEPDGDSIELALLRVRATSEERRIGSLLVNPGGPGVSARDYAASAETYFGPEVRAVFDIVGVDPRGVDGSTPVDCVDDDRLDVLAASDPDPDTATEQAEAESLLQELGDGCVERSGELVAHVTTEEAARDLDVVRAVLGEERLAYFGASYGTLLGATYAELFPKRVGRLVLDGALDPSAGPLATSAVQARGFETALRAYVEDCVDDGDCYLGDSVDEGVSRVGAFLEQLDAEPIRGSDDRLLTQGLGVLGIWAPLYVEDFWPALDKALGAALQGRGQSLLTFADAYLRRGPDGYLDNSTEANYAISCADRTEQLTAADAAAGESLLVEASPTFGSVFAAALAACADWPVPPRRPLALDAKGADPILVVGTSRDPATPLVWAERMAEQLESGVLIRRDGDGHTGYRAGNECVDDAVERYLVSGVVPEGTVDC